MTCNRTLVISDIHGCYTEFTKLLKLTNYDHTKDKLILLGDYVSRGPCSKEVVDFVIFLVEKHGAIALQGNHDHRFVRVIENMATENETSKFFEKGGIETLSSYCNNSIQLSKENLDEIRYYMDLYKTHIQFLKKLPFYYEDQHYIFVHAGLNPHYPQITDQKIEDLLYIKEEFYNHKTKMKKIVVFGHTLTLDIHGSPEIWVSEDKIGIDGGCAFGNQLNCLEIKDGMVNKMYNVKAEM